MNGKTLSDEKKLELVRAFLARTCTAEEFGRQVGYSYVTLGRWKIALLGPNPPAVAPGMTFNSWTVLERAGRKNTQALWKCRCVCGTEREVMASRLVHGYSKTCGCVRNKRTPARDGALQAIHTRKRARYIAKMLGQRFGRLVVESAITSPETPGRIKFLCKCDCGKTREAFGYRLVTKRIKSCNCAKGDSWRGKVSPTKGVTRPRSLIAARRQEWRRASQPPKVPKPVKPFKRPSERDRVAAIAAARARAERMQETPLAPTAGTAPRLSDRLAEISRRQMAKVTG